MNWRACTAGAVLALCACHSPTPEIELSGPTMGTTYTVKVAGAPAGVDPSRIRTTIDAVLARIDASMSGYRGDSEIARFNASTSTEWFETSSDLAAVVAAALAVSEESSGAFDITVAPLVAAWGFGPAGEPQTLPSAAVLEQLKARVGYSNLHVRTSPPALRKDVPELSIDLNGIAPGFAVDRLAERFAALGIQHFMIDIGGEIRVHGRNAHGERWRIAVEQPVDVTPTPYAILQLDDGAVSTSGEYRHYYVRDGRRYSHTIDPRTAQPLNRALGSVVVAGATATQCDAWATAFNVLGPQAGYELARQRHALVMYVDSSGGGWSPRATVEFEKQLRPVFLR